MKPFDVLDAEIYGESHSEEIGGVLKGLPKGETFDPDGVRRFAARRKSGRYLFSTPRHEDDEAVWEGCTPCADGLRIDGPLRVRIFNKNIRPSDYSYALTPRPSHADYCAWVKDGENAAKSGGGRFSGRMTAPLVALGGVAKQLLEKRGIRIAAYISELAGVKGRSYLDGIPSYEEAAACTEGVLPMLSNADEAAASAKAAAAEGDSVGGVTECVVYGMPAGLGDALFGGLESKISAAGYARRKGRGIRRGVRHRKDARQRSQRPLRDKGRQSRDADRQRGRHQRRHIQRNARDVQGGIPPDPIHRAAPTDGGPRHYDGNGHHRARQTRRDGGPAGGCGGGSGGGARRAGRGAARRA